MPNLSNLPCVKDAKAYLHKALNYIQNTEKGLVYLVGCVMLCCACLAILFRPRKKARR